MLSISYFRSKCIGCNGCVEADPNRWRVSKKDGKSILIDGIKKKDVYNATVGIEELDALKSAAINCPTKIIKYTIK
jgi:ferredoxin